MPLWINPYNFNVDVNTVNGWATVAPGHAVTIPNGNLDITPAGLHAPPPTSMPMPILESASYYNTMTFDAHPIDSILVYTPKEKMMPKDTDKDDEYFYNKRLSQIVSFKSGLQKGDIGLEIECEGTHLFNTPFSYWTCHADGSLRETAGHAPIEYVLKNPLSVTEVRDALQYLAVKLKESGSKIIKSNRTSVHVHVNCQQMTIRELYCYLCLWLIFEELLVEWSGPERAGNLFCLRAKDSNFYIGMLESVLKNRSLKQWREDYRYSACNVASITKFGSLEFRSMQGTVNVSEIQTWVEILMMLKEASLRYDNPIEIVEEFTAIGPLPFFKKIFQHKEHRELFEGSQGLSGKLWDGLRMMRDVAYACEWKPYKKKKQPKKKVKLAEMD